MAARFYIEIYPARRGLWRKAHGLNWRAKAAGNREILAQGETYNNRADLLDTVFTLFGEDVPVRDVTE